MLFILCSVIHVGFISVFYLAVDVEDMIIALQIINVV